METFKYSVGDSFVLPFDINTVPLNAESNGKDTINFVLYVSNELLVVLQNHIDSNGNILDNWQVISFDLSIKKYLEFLELQKYEILPTTKFGTLGTFLVYGEGDYILGGITLKSIGSMTFKKPLLIDIYKIAEEITMDVESGSVNYQSTLMRIWDSSTKVPLESDKNLLLVVIQDAKKPVKKYAKIEIDVDSNATNVSDKLLPPLKNVVGDPSSFSSPLVPSANLIGMGLFKPLTADYQFNAVAFSLIAKPFDKSQRIERESVKVSGFGGFTYTAGENVYIMPEGDYVFPSWRLQTDTTFPTGTGFENGKYANVLGKIIIMPEDDKKNRFGDLYETVGGSYNISKYEKDIFVVHPQVFLGGNVKFSENKDDLFLLVGNQPLVGSRGKGGSRAIWSKTIGSTQFPIKTRAQLSKLTKVSLEQQVTQNKSHYEYRVVSDLTSLSYFPKSYESFLRVNYPDFFDNKWDIGRERKFEFNWKAFNTLGEVASNMPNQNIEKVLEYFDYANLNEIQSKNPLLYDKLVFLINKSVDIYFKNLPSKQSVSSNTSARDYLRVEFYKFNVLIKDGLTTNLDLGNLLRFSNQVVYGLTSTIYDEEETQKYFRRFTTIAEEMQQRAMGRVSSYGHPFLSFEDLEFFKPIFWEQYLFPLSLYLKEQNTYLEIDFHNRIESFASNYFTYTELTSFDGIFLNIAPKLILRTNETERWSSSVVSEIDFGNILNFKVQVDSSSPEDSAKTKELFMRLATLCIENIDMLLSINSLAKLLRLFSYYEVVGKKVNEVSIKDLHHDIRFKYFLLESSIMGIFTEKSIPRLIKFITEFGNIIQEVRDIYKDNNYKLFNVRFTLPESIVDWESRDVNSSYIIGSFENSFYGQSSNTSISVAATILMTYVFEDNLIEKMNLMKENELVAKLITEETTPRAEWLKMFGVGAVDVAPIEEDEDDDFFDLDSLDVDDIEIDLSDDEILEDNIEI